MTPLAMIQEWKRGCSCAPKDRPEECLECTRALIDAMERKLLEALDPWDQPDFITPEIGAQRNEPES